MPERRFLYTEGNAKRRARMGDYPSGLERHYAESLTTINTNDEDNWQTVLTLTTGVLAGGNYKIDWTSLITTSNTSTQADLRLMIDGAEHWHGILDSDEDENRVPMGGFLVEALSNAAHTIQLQFKVFDGSTATIYDRRISLERWN